MLSGHAVQRYQPEDDGFHVWGFYILCMLLRHFFELPLVLQSISEDGNCGIVEATAISKVCQKRH